MTVEAGSSRRFSPFWGSITAARPRSRRWATGGSRSNRRTGARSTWARVTRSFAISTMLGCHARAITVGDAWVGSWTFERGDLCTQPFPRLLPFVLPLVQHRASTCRDRDAHPTGCPFRSSPPSTQPARTYPSPRLGPAPGAIRARNPKAPASSPGGLDQPAGRRCDNPTCSVNSDRRCLNVVDRFRLELQTRHAVLATTLVTVSLAHPVADCRSGALELASQLPGRAPRPDQLHHLAPVVRRVRRMCLCHS